MTFQKTMWLNDQTKSQFKVQNNLPLPQLFKCKLFPSFNIPPETTKNVGPPCNSPM